MEFVGADADLRPETEFSAIAEARRGIPEHGRGIDGREELPRRLLVRRNDAVGVVRTVILDVLDGIFQRVDHPDTQDQIEIFGRPILLRGRLGLIAENLADPFVTAQLHALGRQRRAGHREEFSGHIAMDEQRFHGVADTRALALRVERDLFGHLEVGRAVDKHMANTVVVLDHRHARMLHDSLDERVPAARHNHIKVSVHLGEQPHSLAVGERHQLDDISRESRILRPRG